MKKAFSVLLFGFIGISFVYEGHAMFSRTGIRGFQGIIEGASRLNTLSKTVRPASSLARSVLTTTPASAPSGVRGPLFDSSLVHKIKMPSGMFQGQPSLLDAVKGIPTSTTPVAPVSGLSLVDLCRDLQAQPAGASVESKIIEQTVQALPSVCEEVVSGVEASVPTNSVASAMDLWESESSFGLEELFRDDMTGGAITAGSESCIAQGGDLTSKVTLQSPKTFNDLLGVQLAKSLPWKKILWSADMLRLESQQSGWAKAAFRVAAHHAVQYLTSGLVDTAFEYALSSAVAVNPIGLPVMTALQVGKWAYQNPEAVYMAGQTVNKAAGVMSLLLGNPFTGLATGGLGPLAASVADLGSSFVGDALKGASRGVMNFNAMLVEKSVTWLMSGASTVYSKLWAAPVTEPVPAYA